MSNQTIDGVPRELLRWMDDFINDDLELSKEEASISAQLRTLLDAPAFERKPFGYWRVPKSLPLQGAFFPWIEGQSERDVKNALEHEFAVQLLYDTPAAQPQDVPVAWLAQAVGKGGEVYRNKASTNEPTMRDIEIAWGQGVIDRFTIVIKQLYAEQPAPVEGDPIGSFDKHMEYMADNIRLKAEIETLRKKAGRYDWLAKQAETESYGGSEWALPVIDAWEYKPGPQLNEKFKTFDDAIDAAMLEDDND